MTTIMSKAEQTQWLQYVPTLSLMYQKANIQTEYPVSKLNRPFWSDPLENIVQYPKTGYFDKPNGLMISNLFYFWP